MSLVTLGLVAQVIQLLLGALSTAPEVISAGQTAISLLQSNSDPTPEQETTIRVALDLSEQQLQTDINPGAVTPV